MATVDLVKQGADKLSISGLTGATAASRYVGATASGAPASGTFAVGDFVIDRTGKVHICTTAGSPGTWAAVGGGGGSSETTVRIAAEAMRAAFNSPTLSIQQRWTVWLFDATTTEAVAGSVRVPADWTTFDVIAFFTNAGAGSGDVVLRADHDQVTDGDTLGAALSTGTKTTVTAPAQDVAKAVTLMTGQTITDREVLIQFLRVAADAPDTLANDMSLLWVELRKAS